MTGGAITANMANWGGGVYVDNSGSFTMEGGTISGNTTSSVGGGVYVQGEREGVFTKRGGTIDATNSASGAGKVAYVYSDSGFKQRNTAAGPSVNLDSRRNGAAGGWE
jgi:hypothetical protein